MMELYNDKLMDLFAKAVPAQEVNKTSLDHLFIYM